jgi:hypothetical protein
VQEKLQACPFSAHPSPIPPLGTLESEVFPGAEKSQIATRSEGMA